jgi:hypothetical protein
MGLRLARGEDIMRTAALLALLFGCPDGEKWKDTADTYSGDLVITNANNYTYEATFEVEEVLVASGQDSTVCFGDVTTDIRGRPMDPSDLTEITISSFTKTKAEVAKMVVDNSLDQGDVDDYREIPLDEGAHQGATCVHLTDFTIIGNPLIPETEFLENDNTTWLATLWKTAPDGRDDILMSIVIKPVVGEANLEVTMTDSSSAMTFVPDLQTMDHLVTSPGQDYTADWLDVTVDASGLEFDLRKYDRMVIGHTTMATLDEVEDVFLQLYELADEIYFLNVYGLNYAEITDNGNVLRTEDGVPVLPTTLDGKVFEGFTREGYWLIGIDCTTCTSPAPVFLTVVDVP